MSERRAKKKASSLGVSGDGCGRWMLRCLVRKVALGEPRPVWRKAEGGLAVRPARCSVFTSAKMVGPSRSVFAGHFSVGSRIRARANAHVGQVGGYKYTKGWMAPGGLVQLPFECGILSHGHRAWLHHLSNHKPHAPPPALLEQPSLICAHWSATSNYSLSSCGAGPASPRCGGASIYRHSARRRQLFRSIV
jgi:hypothetical protein